MLERKKKDFEGTEIEVLYWNGKEVSKMELLFILADRVEELTQVVNKSLFTKSIKEK